MTLPVEFRAGLTLRDKWTIGLDLLVVCGLAWAVMAWQAAAMMTAGAGDASAMMMSRRSWTPVGLGLIYLMWVVMMVAMMVPATSPMIAAFATVNRRRRQSGRPYIATAVFLAGYLITWSLFSIAATGLQWLLQEAGLLTPMMENASPMLSAVLLVTAGLYQWTPLKDVCLNRCRTPVGFVLTEWRDGITGAVSMGLRHGLFCIGCCFALMGLLFAVAVMDLRWVAAVAGLLTAEKLLSWPRVWRYAIGAILVGTGVAFAASGLKIPNTFWLVSS